MRGSPLTKYEAQDIRSREQALRTWMAERKRNSYRTEEVAHLNPPSNAELSNLEVFEFLHNPPDRYFAYVVQRDGKWLISNWPGAPLSEWCQLGPIYRGNMGDKRRSVEFMGINGMRYVGTFYCGAGDYCRVRKGKEK